MKVKSSRINRNKLSWLLEQDLNVKLEILKNHLEISRFLVNDILEEEVRQLAGNRYSHDRPHNGRYTRWGFNPGSVKLGSENVRIDVPRVYDREEKQHVPLGNYQRLKENNRLDDQVLQAVLSGLSTRDYQHVIEGLLDSFGLSPSSISARFIEVSSARLEAFQKRDLSHHDFVALFIDGKSLAKEQMVIVLGVTVKGDKIPLGFIQTHSENALAIKQLLTEIVGRGLSYQDGLLCVLDGAKGLHKAVREVFGDYALIQRCRWHKRENVLSYLNETVKDSYRRRISRAYHAETLEDAKKQLQAIIKDLRVENLSAAHSLEEGLEETLTLHRLGLDEEFGRSFATTNCIENVNSLMEKHIGKVKYWKNSDQRHRWVACALLEIEKRLRKVDNHKNLQQFKDKITQEVAQKPKEKREAA